MRILLAIANEQKDTTTHCVIESESFTIFEEMSNKELETFILSHEFTHASDVVQGEIREISKLIEHDLKTGVSTEEECREEIENLQYEIDILYYLYAIDCDYRVIREV